MRIAPIGGGLLGRSVLIGHAAPEREHLIGNAGREDVALVAFVGRRTLFGRGGIALAEHFEGGEVVVNNGGIEVA